MASMLQGLSGESAQAYMESSPWEDARFTLGDESEVCVRGGGCAVPCEVEVWCAVWQGRGEVSGRGRGVRCIVGMGRDMLRRVDRVYSMAGARYVVW